MIVDSHCHLNYGGLAEHLDDVVDRAHAAGVGVMLARNSQCHQAPTHRSEPNHFHLST